MQILRGTGPKPRQLPFRYDPVRARKMARLHRLVRKGLTPANKAEMRALADAAAQSHPIHKIKAGHAAAKED